MPTQSSWPGGHPGSDEIGNARKALAREAIVMQARLRAWSAAGVAAILPLPARQTPRVSWCPRARTQSGVGALPGTREWRHEPVLQIRPSVEAPGERRI